MNNYLGEVKAQGDYLTMQKSPLITWLIWWFLGLFGGHRFYLDKTKELAIIQLVLTLTIFGVVVTAVWCIVDAFMLPRKIREVNGELLHDLRVYYGAEEEVEHGEAPQALPHQFPIEADAGHHRERDQAGQ